MKNLIIFIAIVTLLIACTKNSNKEYVLTGRLMQSCDTPAANRNGLIHFSGGGILNKPSTSLEFTTDESGYFKVTHNRRFSEFTVRTSNNHPVLEVYSLSGDNNDLGEVYIFPPSVSYYLKLEVNNSSYTDQDTLTYYDWGYPQNGAEHWVKRKAGPFTDGIIDTVSLAVNLNGLPISFSSDKSPKLRIDYGVVTWNQNFVYIPTPHCQEDYQTVTLIIE
jgi:hypothetical protein